MSSCWRSTRGEGGGGANEWPSRWAEHAATIRTGTFDGCCRASDPKCGVLPPLYRWWAAGEWGMQRWIVVSSRVLGPCSVFILVSHCRDHHYNNFNRRVGGGGKWQSDAAARCQRLRALNNMLSCCNSSQGGRRWTSERPAAAKEMRRRERAAGELKKKTSGRFQRMKYHNGWLPARLGSADWSKSLALPSRWEGE